MKFLSSSSSSSVASTTTAAATTGCLAAMLRRLLCFNTLPTHQDFQSKDNDLNSVEFDKLETEEKIVETANPGIVARLMGLELMPRIEFSDTQMKPSSITRSRSVNYDSSRKNESIEGQHRRAKTSLSFCEMPTFLEHEEFFVLSFENLGRNNEFRSKGNRSEAGGGKLKRRKAEKWKRRKCERGEKVSGEDIEQLKLINKKEKCNGGKQRKAEDVIGVKKAETECCNSENSSPVSVLDFCESIFHPIVPTSEEEEDASCKGSNSRRKLSTELENHEHSSSPCEPSISTCDIHTKKMIHGKCYGSMEKNCQRETNVQTWGEICKIAEAEMIESNWVKRALWKLEDCRDIGAECELQILQELLNQVVDQLVETPQKILDMEKVK